MNLPGRADGNWTWRCTQDMLSGHEFEWLRELTRATNRLAMPPRPLAMLEAS
jgi:hypothetical protein